MSLTEKPKCELRARRTGFVRLLRTTPPATVCPNFYVLAHANGCTFSPRCSYCYLKSSFWYLRREYAFTNVDDMVSDVQAWIAKDDLESYALNAGNLSDSLSFEGARPLVQTLVEVFREEAEGRGRRHSLLLVTKGGVQECEPLLALAPCRNVAVSLSVNSPEAAREHEPGAPSVTSRLEAARRLKSRGWRVRIRIDPMMSGFGYSWVVEQIRRLEPERVTLGTLRAEANLFRVVGNGLFADLEKPAERRGLARYPREQRLALYRPAVRALSPVCSVGLCEETADVWKELGLNPRARSCNCEF